MLCVSGVVSLCIWVCEWGEKKENTYQRNSLFKKQKNHQGQAYQGQAEDPIHGGRRRVGSR